MKIHSLFNPRSSRLKYAASGVWHLLQQQSWVLAIGNFDGVHRGHQMLLQQLSARAASLGSLRAAMVFEPQPLEYLRGDQAPIRIMGVRDKVEALFGLGVELVLLCRFDENMLKLSPDQFMKSLRRHLNLKGLVLGRDFRFGFQRQGDMKYLHSYGRQHDIDVYAMPDVTEDDIRVSSSLIRAHIQGDRFGMARFSLGRPFLMTGRIKHGLKLARNLGFPTANLHIVRKTPPISGVFVGRAYLPYNDPSDTSGVWYRAVANAGTKPTVNGVRWQIEVHIFDDAFDSGTIDHEVLVDGGAVNGGEVNGGEVNGDTAEGSYYGLRLAFEPLERIRDEKRFSSVSELKRAISADVSHAAAYFEKQV